MTDLDDLDLMDATTPATPNVTTKKCRRHDWGRPVGTWNAIAPCVVCGLRPLDHPGIGSRLDHYWTQGENQCQRCNVFRDPIKSRRARLNGQRGRAIQRKRIEALGGTNLAGNNENLDGIGLAFAFESKSGGAFSERYWRWLDGIPTNAGRTPVLIVTEAPGPGRRARSFVVVKFDDWRDLHGE